MSPNLSEEPKKRSSPKIEAFLSPKSREDQKKEEKRSSPKIEAFLSPKSCEDQKKEKEKVFTEN